MACCRGLSCEGARLCIYSSLRDYGGWGIRYGSKGKAYNVSGSRGVRLELSNGKRLLIGSQRPEELSEAVAAALKHVIR
jgi:hypothetical protein